MPTPNRHVIAVAGPSAGQHGTARATDLRRTGLLTLWSTSPPQLVAAGCEVTWDDGTTGCYPVAWLRTGPCPPVADRYRDE